MNLTEKLVAILVLAAIPSFFFFSGQTDMAIMAGVGIGILAAVLQGIAKEV